MRFCTKCDNLLLTKEGKLFCRTCNAFSEVPSNIKQEYVIVKAIKHENSDLGPIIVKDKSNGNNISHEDRKAREEFFLQA